MTLFYGGMVERCTALIDLHVGGGESTLLVILYTVFHTTAKITLSLKCELSLVEIPSLKSVFFATIVTCGDSDFRRKILDSTVHSLEE